MHSGRSVIYQTLLSASLKFASLALFLLATPLFSFAQTLKLALQDQDQQPVLESRLVLNGKDILIKESVSFIPLDLPMGSKVSFAVSKSGFKGYTGAFRIKKDTTSLRITLKKETILLPEVGITAGRLKNEQTKEVFNALDYYVDDSVVLILGKVGSKAQLRSYDQNLKLKSIGVLPYNDLKLLIDCNNIPVLYNDTTAFKIELTNNKVNLTRDVLIENVNQYLTSPCILMHREKYFFRSTNPSKTNYIFYYSDVLADYSQLYFVASNEQLAAEIKNYIPSLQSVYGRYIPFDPNSPLVPIELSHSLDNIGMTTLVNSNNDGFMYLKKVLMNPGQCSLFYHSNQFHILDLERLQYHSIDTGYTRCNTGSFAHLAGAGKWSKKFFADEEYSRLFTTYVQGETRIVEVKGEKLDETKTVATIPFSGYFPEKIKVRGPYLYYLLFYGKKRVLYRQKLEGY